MTVVSWGTSNMAAVKGAEWGKTNRQTIRQLCPPRRSNEKVRGRFWGREGEAQFCIAWLHTITSGLSRLLEGSQWVPHAKGGAYIEHGIGHTGRHFGNIYCSQVHCLFLYLGRLLIFVFKVILLIAIVYVWGHAHGTQHACGGQRTTLEVLFYP